MHVASFGHCEELVHFVAAAGVGAGVGLVLGVGVGVGAGVGAGPGLVDGLGALEGVGLVGRGDAELVDDERAVADVALPLAAPVALVATVDAAGRPASRARGAAPASAAAGPGSSSPRVEK